MKIYALGLIIKKGKLQYMKEDEVFLLAKIHLFQTRMKKEINQSINRPWLRHFPISQGSFEFYLEKYLITKK